MQMRVSKMTIGRERLDLTPELFIGLVAVVGGGRCSAPDRFGGFTIVEVV